MARQRKVANVQVTLKHAPPKCTIRKSYIIKRGPNAGTVIPATVVCKKQKYP